MPIDDLVSCSRNELIIQKFDEHTSRASGSEILIWLGPNRTKVPGKHLLDLAVNREFDELAIFLM